jgi:hypothetical protein
VATQSIVTSSTQSDTGTFESNLRDERYLPFEGAGVISTWAIALPAKPRQFDYDTIVDLILTIRYTARPGALADAVTPAVQDWLKANAARLFSLRHEFATEWARFKRAEVTPGQRASLAFELKDEHFPYRLQEVLANAKQFHLVGDTNGQRVDVELFRGTTSVGTTTLVDAEPVAVPLSGNFDARGKFELRLDPAAIEDLWLVVDWASAPE